MLYRLSLAPGLPWVHRAAADGTEGFLWAVARCLGVNPNGIEIVARIVAVTIARERYFPFPVETTTVTNHRKHNHLRLPLTSRDVVPSDLKASSPQGECGFDSHSRYQTPANQASRG
jgi:hypothetical protein